MEREPDRASHLPSLVKELGYSCAVDEASFRAVLANCSELNEAVVAETLFFLTQVIGEKSPGQFPTFSLIPGCPIRELTESAWNLKNVVSCIKDAAPNLNWVGVANSLDFHGFLLSDQPAFVALVELFRVATQEHFPREAVLGKVWKNVEGHLSFLRFAVSAPPEVFSFEGTKTVADVIKDDGYFRSTFKSKYLKFTPNYAWLSIDLYRTLCLMSDAALPSGACREILLYPAQYYPELVLYGMVSVNTEWSSLQRDVFASLLPFYIAGKKDNSSEVLRNLSLTAPIVMVELLANYLTCNFHLLTRVLDVCQELGNIQEVLSRLQYPVSLEVALWAVKRGMLNIDVWTQDLENSESAAAVLRYLSDGLTDLQYKGREADSPLTQVSVKAILNILQKVANTMSPEAAKEFQNVKGLALRLFPGLLAQPSAPSVEVFSSDVENEASGYFNSYYKQLLSVEEMVGKMKSLTNSPDLRNVSVFNCLIHNLYDEYKFLRNYPKQHLRQTAILLGSLVKHRVIVGRDLKTALQYVLKALQTPASSNMFAFAIDALREFASQPQPSPEFYAGLLTSAELASEHPELFGTIRRVVEEQQAAVEAGLTVAVESFSRPPVSSGPPGMGSPFSLAGKTGSSNGLSVPGPLSKLIASSDISSGGSSGASGRKSLEGPDASLLTNANSARLEPASLALVNTESLESAAEKYKRNFTAPPEGIQDRIHFLINNLTIHNYADKSDEIKEKMSPKYLNWFANYVVVKRAAQEANFHQLYISLLEKMGDKELYKLMVSTTLYYVKVLLYSERIIKESNDRTLLKNLGSWLGLLTFANNKPLLGKDLEVKSIIIEAYQRGRLMSVLPFIQKLLECCKDSKIYRPTNPMIAGILAVLAELHSMKDLKINNMFSIELVFRAFGLKPSDMAPSDILKSLQRERKQNPDWSVPQEAVDTKTISTPVTAAAAAAAAAGARAGSAALSTIPPRVSPSPAIMADGKIPTMMDTAGHGAAAAATGGSIVPMQHVMQPPGSLPPGGVAGQVPQGLHPDFMFANLHQHVVINQSLGSLADRLQLKRHVPVAVDRAIGEIITQVVERSVPVALYTSYELVMKDFAFDADEGRMRKSAHMMVSSLAGSLSLVYCKDMLRIGLTQQLRSMLQGQLDASTLDQVVSVVVADNLELGCTLIERATVERAMREVDKALLGAYEERAKARALNKQWAPAEQYVAAQQRLPEGLRAMGRQSIVQPLLMRVYEDFSKVQRAAPPVNAAAAAAAGAASRLAGFSGAEGMDKSEAALLGEKYALWQQNVDAAIAAREHSGALDTSDLQTLHAELAENPVLAAGNEESAVFLGKRILRHLWEVAAPASGGAVLSSVLKLSLNFHVTCLETLVRIAVRRLPGELTALFWQVDDERRFNKVVVEALLRCGLLALPELDRYLAKSLTAGGTGVSLTILVMHLLQVCVVRDAIITCADIPATMDVLSKLATSAPNVALMGLLDQARKIPAAPPAIGRAAGEIPPALREKGDLFNLKERSAGLFEEWVRILNSHEVEKQGLGFLISLRDMELLQLNEYTDRFFCLLIEISVGHCLSNTDPSAAAAGGARPQDLPLNFLATDALVHLITALVHNGGGEAILSRFLGILTAVIKRDSDEALIKFNARPYLRIWVGLLSDLGAVDKAFVIGRPPASAAEPPSEAAAAAALRYLKICGVYLYQLQPLSVPGFAFAWLELISHRAFMPKMLSASAAASTGSISAPAGAAACGSLYFSLLAALLRFLEPYLRLADMSDSIKQMYRGTLRLLLVLLQDFPEVLCEHHLQLCELIAPTAVQMRNLVLSAFPKNMHLPDPFSANLKVDLLPETQLQPRIVPDPEQLLPEVISVKVQDYLMTRQPAVLPQELAKLLVLNPVEAKALGTNYNVPLINSLILYIGCQAKTVSSIYHPAAQELFARLASELDSEGRYLMLNAMANHLRYPNAHTYYFSCSLLTLFMDSNSEGLKEQITRVLLERLLVNRPHPWGLLITFIELIKNRRYNFWAHNFTKCAPEIENVFTNLSRTFGNPCGRGEEESLNSNLVQKDTSVRI